MQFSKTVQKQNEKKKKFLKFPGQSEMNPLFH